jgi:hypothetical protein
MAAFRRGNRNRLTGLGLALILIAGCTAPAEKSSTTLAPAEPVTLAASDYTLAPAGTVVTWRNLLTGETMEERIGAAQGLMMQSEIGARRSYAYLPDPWADNENTRQDDIVPLFPLEVGKKVSFTRKPKAGLAHDTVEVLRSETLTLPIGKVDTYVIHTKSEIAADGWVGESTFWYAPELDWYVQAVIKSSDGDLRERQVISITKPGVE